MFCLSDQKCGYAMFYLCCRDGGLRFTERWLRQLKCTCDFINTDLYILTSVSTSVATCFYFSRHMFLLQSPHVSTSVATCFYFSRHMFLLQSPNVSTSVATCFYFSRQMFLLQSPYVSYTQPQIFIFTYAFWNCGIDARAISSALIFFWGGEVNFCKILTLTYRTTHHNVSQFLVFYRCESMCKWWFSVLILCVCVCVYIYIYTHTHTHTNAYTIVLLACYHFSGGGWLS